ncbi:MAG TPA: PHP domain-containing protein, partial [Gemmatimonadaceae bacterium]|nr:PHP domain-containing protein [Gemmatimonadaceae bacterium]
IDGTELDLYCTLPDNAGLTLWRATGSDEHVSQMRAFAAGKGLTIRDDDVLDSSGRPLRLATEKELFERLGLQEIPAELREGMGEIEAAAKHSLPNLLLSTDIRGALHCHSTWSDGMATIEEMANAARERGWSYIGITDHSEAAFYAGGMKRDKVQQQHDEIDEINSRMKGFRVLKGIEADILAEGRLDYADDILDMFEYVIGSVHSRFSMSGSAMTDRVLKAMDDPRLTILGHPTGRLLLSREPYEIDIDAVIEKAAEAGTVLELNADPHRLDLDWRHVREAKDRGVMIEIGPDAHSERGLDAMDIGVGMARKGWLEKTNVLNAQTVTKVLSFAKARRAKG